MKDRLVKDATTVSKSQADEKCEALVAENRKLVDRAVKAEASNKRLAAQHALMVERIAELEAQIDVAVPTPEHVQRTLEQFERREADLIAEVEALKTERDGLRLEIGACRETAEELKVLVRQASAVPAAPELPALAQPDVTAGPLEHIKDVLRTFLTEIANQHGLPWQRAAEDALEVLRG